MPRQPHLFDMAAHELAQWERKRERESAHLPADFEEAVAYFRDLIDKLHEARLGADDDSAADVIQEAVRLATKLNGGRMGILAPDGAGTRLIAATAAPDGEIPKWGQAGRFMVTAKNCRTWVRWPAMLDIYGKQMSGSGFEIEAVDLTKPFFSETGYRSCIGHWIAQHKGMTPDVYAVYVLEERVFPGNLVPIRPEYGGPKTRLV